MAHGAGGAGEPLDPIPDLLGEQEGMEKAVGVAPLAVGAIGSMRTLAILALLGTLIGGPPQRRLVVVPHLSDPRRPPSPTTRIDLGRRLVEIAVGDAGVVVAYRVRLRLGVSPGDVEVQEPSSAWACDAVWERLDDKEQVRCMYRGL